MKQDAAEYVALCGMCERVKAEHQRPAGLLQPLKVPEWKWEKSVWISLSDYLMHSQAMTQYG